MKKSVFKETDLLETGFLYLRISVRKSTESFWLIQNSLSSQPMKNISNLNQF
jgi:hypothetical protein